MQGKEFKFQHEASSLNPHNLLSKMKNRWSNSQSALKGNVHRVRSSESIRKSGGVDTIRLKSVGQGSILDANRTGIRYVISSGSYVTGERFYIASGLPTGDTTRSYFSFKLPKIERFRGDKIIEATLSITVVDKASCYLGGLENCHA